jgi:Asp-tRNA(Asn)/Glu-tRNA(Gln) amidotransferase C subunit
MSIENTDIETLPEKIEGVDLEIQQSEPKEDAVEQLKIKREDTITKFNDLEKVLFCSHCPKSIDEAIKRASLVLSILQFKEMLGAPLLFNMDEIKNLLLIKFKDMDYMAEYRLIEQKKSTLSSTERKLISMIYSIRMKKEYYEITQSAMSEQTQPIIDCAEPEVK